MSRDEGSRTPTERVRPTPPSERTLWFLVVPLVFLVVLSWIGDASFASLTPDENGDGGHPLLLMAMNARNRNLVLVANYVDIVPFYLVGTLRLLLADPLFYLLGYWYGERAVRWIEGRWDSGSRIVEQLDRLFAKASYPLVFLAPNNLFCTLAGSSGMRPPTFFALNIGGTIFRLTAIRIAADYFADELDAVLGFIADYRMPVIAVSILVVGTIIAREFRAGGTDVQILLDMEHDLAEAADDTIDREIDGDNHDDTVLP